MIVRKDRRSEAGFRVHVLVETEDGFVVKGSVHVIDCVPIPNQAAFRKYSDEHRLPLKDYIGDALYGWVLSKPNRLPPMIVSHYANSRFLLRRWPVLPSSLFQE